MPAPLHLEHLGVSVGGQRILQEVHFTLNRGELAWLTGPNGAGKSTFLRAVAGLLPATGQVCIAGARGHDSRARAAFTFVPDEPALYEDLTLSEHAKFTALAYREPEVEARVLAWLERFALRSHLGEFPGHHSRGMRQKLSLSLALALQRPLLLLDEPFNGLDVDAQAVLSAGLCDAVARGGAVMLSAHQLELTHALLRGWPHSRVLELHAGTLHEAQVKERA